MHLINRLDDASCSLQIDGFCGLFGTCTARHQLQIKQEGRIVNVVLYCDWYFCSLDSAKLGSSDLITA
jgi:hypothetical protein